MSVVITHEKQGIYVGNALGFGFWSMLDTAGQTEVPTFENERQAREHVASWIDHNDPDDYRYVEVKAQAEMSATADELAAAGLEGMLGELRTPAPTP